MDYLMLILRIIHIFGGVFWVGGALMMNLFVGPSVAATGEAGQQVVRHLMSKAGLSARLAAAGGLTVLAGFFLYWLDSDGFSSAWTRSGPGIGFAIGAAAGLLGFILGIMISRKNKELGGLGAEVKGQPTKEQAEKLAAIQKSLAQLGPLNTASLIIATIFMATARYLVF